MAAPKITKITAANLTDGLSALYTHFNGTSTKWELDAGVSGNSATGFIIVQQTPTGVGQISLRRSSTTALQCLLDPTGSITAAGNTSSAPVGADADESSPEYSITVSTSTTQELTLLEWDDSIAVLVRTTTSTYSTWIAAGRAVHQDFDGPELYVGSPGGTGSLMVRTTGTQAQNWQSIIGYQYWTPSGGAALPTVSNVGGLYLSTPELIGPASGNIPLGRLRYFCRNSPQQSPTYPYSIPSTPTREVVYIGTSTTSLVIEWEPGVTP